MSLTDKEKKVMVFGTFDNLHKGHLDYFKQARTFGDYLIAVVARDKNVLKQKGKLPRNNQIKRLKSVQKFVDKAILGSRFLKYKVISRCKPNIICLGYDQKADLDHLKRFGIPIVRLKSFMPEKYKSSKL